MKIVRGTQMILYSRYLITATRLEEETIQASVSPTMLPTLIVEDTDYQRSDILEQNFTRHVCGLLIKKCFGRHSCPVCEEYAKLYQELDDSSLFCYLKAYQTSEVPFGSLQMPPDNFVYYISMMEVLFQNNFERFATELKVVHNLYKILIDIKFEHPCKNFPKKYLICLFIRLRVFYTLKFINWNFKNPSGSNKLIIWSPQ
jgi:hypothetical protein